MTREMLGLRGAHLTVLCGGLRLMKHVVLLCAVYPNLIRFNNSRLLCTHCMTSIYSCSDRRQSRSVCTPSFALIEGH